MLLYNFFLTFFLLVLYFIKLKHENFRLLQATVLNLGEILFTQIDFNNLKVYFSKFVLQLSKNNNSRTLVNFKLFC